MPEDWRVVEIEWQGESGFIGRNFKGGEIQIGQIHNQPGASPMELLLMSLAGCTGSDVISILEKKRQNLSELKIAVRGRRKDEHPRSYSKIEVTFHLWGEDLDRTAVERAIELSETKYCSVSAMLKEAAEIEIKYEIHQSDPEGIF